MDAVRSALAQTYPHIQVVVHDNNSSDGTEVYLKSHISDSRLEFYRVDEDLSMTENWNKSLSYAHGEYFLRLDDDNVITNDLVQSGLNEISVHALDAINFSPVIIQLNGRMQRLFDAENKTFVLDKFQLLYLEYFALLDSNYTLYRMSTIQKLFPSGDYYQTTLPDRHMDYQIAGHMDAMHIRFGVCPKLKGLTRYDYRPVVASDFSLAYVEYRNLRPEDVISLKDCQFNFSMHRVSTLSYFLSRNEDDELRAYANDALMSPQLYSSMMRLGHACMGGTLRSVKEIPAFFGYLSLSFIDFLRFPKARMEGRSMIANIDSLLKNGLLVLGRFLRTKLSRQVATDLEVDMSRGNTLSEEIIAGGTPTFEGKPEHGSLETVLANANGLKRYITQ